jgi:hypothetical protein
MYLAGIIRSKLGLTHGWLGFCSRSTHMATRPTRIARNAEPVQSPARQIAGFIAKFDRKDGALIRACRGELRKRLPTAFELVYDNYNFLVFGFCSSPRASACICSLACAANGVALSFYYGATLPDPQGVLLGSGSQNRFVRLAGAATLREPAVAALIDAAVASAEVPLPRSEPGKTIVQSVSAKQRPRRAGVAGGTAGVTRKAKVKSKRTEPVRAKRA